MPPIHSFVGFLTLFLQLHLVSAVTVYYQPGQAPLSSAAGTAAGAKYTGAAAYDPTVLTPPPVPNPFNTQFAIQLQNGAVANLSIPQPGSFLGFSVEMSVVNQVVGKNSSLLQVAFLNLMANIQERAGSVTVRVGGNSQESATLVSSTSSGRILEKNITATSNPTNTPPLDYTTGLIYMLRNVSALVNVRWFLGIPFFNVTPPQLAIAEASQAILGDFLLGLQAGNEPDLYSAHNHRPSTYGPFDYFGEFGTVVQAVNSDQNIPNKNTLIGPSLATTWTPEQVWNTGFVDSYSSSLAYLAFERYPADNCGAQFGLGQAVDPQTVFPTYLSHQLGQQLCQTYLNSTAYAQSKGKKVLMFETNTASCGGFPGISDSFGAALWGLDYSLQMAYSNFSGAMFHVGGQNVYYNPFTPPPTNQSTYHEWTIGPIYYSALIMAEILGPSNTSQVVDLNSNNGNQFTPAYAIYQSGTPVRVALFNYVTDSSGNSNLLVSISVGGGQTGQPNATPAEVKVKYFTAPSVSQKGNLTWADQTFGDVFGSDGRPMGTENVQTIQCDQTNNVCQIKVPAPGFALVFLNDNTAPGNGAGPTTTFSTSSVTKSHNTLSVDPKVLATSNGHTGMDQKLGSTSHGSVNAAEGARWRGAGWVFGLVVSVAVVLVW